MCAKLPYVPTYLVIMQNIQEKANLQKTKANMTKITKVCADRNKLCTGKEWKPYAQYSLGGKLIVVVSE